VPKGNVYLKMRDVLGSIYMDEQFAVSQWRRPGGWRW
jgi:hypothetical protein